jgi:hypothetical protein
VILPPHVVQPAGIIMPFAPSPPVSLLALLLAAAALPAQAGSLATSSAAGGSSASSAASSASDSSKESSNSSRGHDRVAEGPYKIIDIVALADRPGTVRLRLQALADAGPGGEVLLDLPEQTADQGRLATGQTVTARQRPYGTEFAHADTDQAFFLVLSAAWSRELVSNPVLL